MVFESFAKKPFKDRLKDTGYLVKNSFMIIGKDKDIRTPTIHMIILSLAITVLIYSAILLFLIGKFVALGIIFLLGALFFLMPFRFFYDVRQKADQSWIVYNTICGRDISYTDAHSHTKSEKGKLRTIALVDILMKYAKSQKGRGRGIAGMLITLFFSFLEEVWDLLSHYMIPAIAIEQKPIREILPQIKALRNNVPAALVGVFGIDFVGSVVGSLFMGIFFIVLLLSFGIGYIVAQFTQFASMTVGGISFSWMPIFVALFLVSAIGTVYRKVVESVKVIYFTIFYASISRPMEIRKEMRAELTNYLLMKKSDFATGQDSSQKQQYIGRLSDYIRQYENRGYSEQQIKQFLLSKGYSEKDVNSAIRNIK